MATPGNIHTHRMSPGIEGEKNLPSINNCLTPYGTHTPTHNFVDMQLFSHKILEGNGRFFYQAGINGGKYEGNADRYP